MSLQVFTLHNTSVNGTLPGVTRATYLSPGFDTKRLCGSDGAGLGRLPTLQLATISDTHMNAAALCDKSDSRRNCDDINEYLPWWDVRDFVCLCLGLRCVDWVCSQVLMACGCGPEQGQRRSLADNHTAADSPTQSAAALSLE